METMINISKLTRQAGLAFAAVLWLGLNTAGISSARAADVSNTCAVQFHPCKINSSNSKTIYPNSRIEEMQKGCLNTVPVEPKVLSTPSDEFPKKPATVLPVATVHTAQK